LKIRRVNIYEDFLSFRIFCLLLLAFCLFLLIFHVLDVHIDLFSQVRDFRRSVVDKPSIKHFLREKSQTRDFRLDVLACWILFVVKLFPLVLA
jgi:hypothetical protein